MPCTGVASADGTFVKTGRPEKKNYLVYAMKPSCSKGLQKMLFNSRNPTFREHILTYQIKLQQHDITNLKREMLLSPRTEKLLVTSDDPRMFLAAHVYGPASL